MLRDDDARVRRDDDALGRERAVRGPGRSVVQRRDRGNELPHETQRGVDVEIEPVALGHGEHVRQPRASRMLGHERERRAAVETIDPPHARDSTGAGTARVAATRSRSAASNAGDSSSVAKRSCSRRSPGRSLTTRRVPSGSVNGAGAVKGTTDAGCMVSFSAVARAARPCAPWRASALAGNHRARARA